MALGVLNNLSAIYAENNLNNTSNSLQTVLQQLSSGSRINSGADDSAGLSLVNGLQANSTALTQSATNAAEGIGLLKVADGSLSQVTNLLNRAITLATEASNGTLNASQSSAANQEYQSILSEINNIGSTTTYNQQQVFGGGTVAIYTGDSSAAGSSIDNLSIRALSSSNVGDTGGLITYSNGANNVFLNLSTSSANAALTDTLNGGMSGSTTVNISYLVRGSYGAQSTATTSITVGGSTSYANTASGLISAINNSGLGLTASFSSQSQAGVTGGGSQTGIQISGGLVSAGVDPSSASTSGTLNPVGIPAGHLLTQGQMITVKVGTQTAAVVTISPSVNTLEELKNAINASVGGTAGLATASVVTNGDGTKSLSLADATATGGPLTVTTTSGTGPATPLFTGLTTAADAPTLSVVAATRVTGVAATPPVNGSVTFGASGTNAGGDILSEGGSITLRNSIPNNTTTLTFTVGTGTDTATTFFTANHGDFSNTLDNLAATINSEGALLGASAVVSASGITVAASVALNGENVTVTSNSLTNANSTLGLYNPTSGGAASSGSATVTALYASASATQNDVITGTITLSNGTPADDLTFTATAGQTYSDLATAINGSNLGVTATWSNASKSLLLTSTVKGAAAITVSGSPTLGDATAGTASTRTTTSLYAGSGATVNDVITGSITLNGNGNSLPFTAGPGETWADLEIAINGANLGVTASWSSSAKALLLTSTTPGAQSAVTATAGSSLADLTIGAPGAPTVSNFAPGSGATPVNTNFLTGTATFTAGANQFTFTGDGSTTTYDSLVTALNQSALGVTASFTGNKLVITSNTDSNAAITMAQSGTALTDFITGVALATGITTLGSGKTPAAVSVMTGGANGSVTGTAGTPVAVAAFTATNGGVAGAAGSAGTYGTALLQLNAAGMNLDDTNAVITGQIQLKNGSGTTQTFIMGVNNTGNPTPADTVYTGANTVASLLTSINGDATLGITAAAPGTGTGAIYLQSNTVGTAITMPTSTLASAVPVIDGTPDNGVTAVTGAKSLVTVGVASGGLNTSDVLVDGSAISLTNGGITHTFSIGTGATSGNNTALAAGSTLADLATAISGVAALEVNATANTTGLSLISANFQAGDITVNSSSLADATKGTYSRDTLGSFASQNETLSGSINFSVGGTAHSVATTVGQTVSGLISDINLNSSTLGVTAQWVAGSNGYGSVQLTSNTIGSSGQISAALSTIEDTTATANLSYTAATAYNVGISGNVADSITMQSAATFVSDARASSGIATVNYTDGAGQSLSATDLSTQADAQATLNALNAAITDVAAMDGYIGGQINMLNSVSSVLTTQLQNVIAAQNAIQATDYAAATANMSKYEILSQTGIAALAQANSVQKEVVKLLQ